MRYKTKFLSLIIPLLLVSGCSKFILEVDQYIEEPPPLLEAPPRIIRLVATPSSLVSGVPNDVKISIEYEDWNENVGPKETRIHRSFEKNSGNFRFDMPPAFVLIPVKNNGRTGVATYSFRMTSTPRVQGELILSLSIYDRSDMESDVQSIILPISRN